MVSRKQGVPLRKKPSVSRQGTSADRRSRASGLKAGLLVDAFGAAGADIDIGAVADTFAMSKSQLAETIGIGREAFYKQARSGAPKTQTRLREMLEILSRVSDWAGGKERAMAWYRAQPISALGGRTAELVVKSGNAAAVRDYLDHIALGGYS